MNFFFRCATSRHDAPIPLPSRPLIKAEYVWREGRPHILMRISLQLFLQTERKNI